jgi:hypothetical protein
MSKYYTPDISDLFVGYECERILPDFSRYFDIFLPEGASKEEYDKAWDDVFYLTDKVKTEPYIIRANQEKGMGPDIREDWGPRGRFRTPYLTKEQIEKEGWEQYSHLTAMDNPFDITYVLKKNEYTCRFSWDRQIAFFQPAKEGEEWWEGRMIFLSKDCLSINEFRKICKLLGI